MILRSIRLSNIRSYVSQSMDFPDGSFLLSGDIGSGKSTILLAAEFALFGIMRGDLSGENLLRHGAKEGSVELKLDIDGHEVMIRRNLKRAKDSVKQESGFVMIDGKKEEGTHVELKSKVLSLLGYPQELVSKSKSLVYRYTVYTPQEQMKHILFDDREERLNILRRVFGIDKYRRIAENSQYCLKSLRENSKLLEGRIFGLDEKQKRLQQDMKELKDAEARLKKLSADAGNARKAAEAKSRIFEEKEKDISQLRELKKDLELCSIRLNEKVDLRQKQNREQELIDRQVSDIRKKILALDVKDTRHPKDVEESIGKKDASIKEIQQKKTMLTEKISYLEKRVLELRKEVSESQKQDKEIASKERETAELKKKMSGKAKLKQDSESIEREMKELEKRLNGFEVTKRNSEELVSNISKLDNCPTCLQSVDREHKRKIREAEEGKIRQSIDFMKQHEKTIREKSAMLDDIRKKSEMIVELEKKAEKMTAEILMMKKAKEGIAQKQKDLLSSEKELNSSKSELDELRKNDVKSLAKELEDERRLLSRVQERTHLNDMLSEKLKRKDELVLMQDELKKDVAEINRTKIELNGKMKPLADAEKRYLEAKKELDSSREKLRKSEIDEKGLATQVQSIKAAAENMQKEIDKMIDSKKKLEKVNNFRRWIDEQFLNVVNVIEKNVMFKIHTQFMELFQQWFNVLVEDEALSINLDENFTPVVVQDGYEAGIEGLSGGEKTAIALAYRLSLNKVINDIVGTIKTKDIIILDEPTDGFSSEQLDKVREVIDELNMKQVIIVSHEPKVESFVDSVVRVQKEGHVSSVIG